MAIIILPALAGRELRQTAILSIVHWKRDQRIQSILTVECTHCVVAATLSEPVMHFYHYSGRKVVENYFQKQPCFSEVGESLVGTPNADYLLLDWYSYLTLQDLNFRSFHLAKSSSLGRYRLYRVGPEL